MRKILLLLVVASTFGLESCGGGNADADAFCDCFEKFEAGNGKECEGDMEKLEEAFKEDEARYKAFAEAARAKCPNAEKYIKKMN